MRPSCDWFRYPWENDPNWPYFWVADPQFIKSDTGIWLPQKGGEILSILPSAGSTFPTLEDTWGPRQFPCLKFNGTSDLLYNPNLAAICANGFHEFTIMLAFQCYSPVPINGIVQIAAFSDTSDAVNSIVFQTSPLSPFVFRGVVIPTTGTAGAANRNNGDNDQREFSWAYARSGSDLYQAVSGTHFGIGDAPTNVSSANYVTSNISLSRFTVGGFWGATKIPGHVRLRAVGLTPTNLSNGSANPSPADDSQLCVAAYLQKELAA